MSMADTTKTIFERIAPSPAGPLRLLATDDALVGVYFPEHKWAHTPAVIEVERHPVLDSANRQLGEYFSGRRTTFDLPIDVTRFGATPFQMAVWKELLAIPFGQTRSYGELAARLGKPTASRAVGAANGKNPLSIIVPCHRVIGASGLLTGYGGGMANKRLLLDLESTWLASIPHESIQHGSIREPRQPAIFPNPVFE